MNAATENTWFKPDVASWYVVPTVGGAARRVTLRYEPDVAAWYVVGSKPGPAGLAELELAEDVWLAVDAADPDRLVHLMVSLPLDAEPATAVPAETLALVTRLLGKRMARRLARPVGVRSINTSIRATPTPAMGAAGRLALLQGLRKAAREEHPSPWWAAEAALLANLVGGPMFSGYARRQAREAAPGLVALAYRGDTWWHGLDGMATERLRVLAEGVCELLRAAARAGDHGTDPLIDGVDELVAQLRATPGGGGLPPRGTTAGRRLKQDEVAVSPPGSPFTLRGTWSVDGADRDRGRRRESVLVRTFRDRVVDEHYRNLAEAARMDVSWMPWSPLRIVVPVRAATHAEDLEGLFVRIFDAETGRLLGAAELQLDRSGRVHDEGSGARAVADVALPLRYLHRQDSRTPHRLAVDLTSRPDEPIDARRHREALWVGALAAQARRVGDGPVAALLWRRCADLWSELGDQVRARQALARANAAAAPVASASMRSRQWFAGEYLSAVIVGAQDEATTADQSGPPEPAGALDAPAARPRSETATRHARTRLGFEWSTVGLTARLALRDWRRLRELVAFYLTTLALKVSGKLKLSAYGAIVASVVCVVATSLLVLDGRPGWAGIALLVACFFEIIDGRLAPHARNSRRVVYVEQVVDRFVEMILFGAIWWHHRDSNPTVAMLSIVTLVLALIASFERAEAGSLRFKHGNAAFGRIMRLALLLPALLFPVTTFFMMLIAGVTVVSLAWRFYEVWVEGRGEDDGAWMFDPAAITANRVEKFPSDWSLPTAPEEQATRLGDLDAAARGRVLTALPDADDANRRQERGHE